MKEINIDRVYPLNRHHNIKILHDFNPLKSFTLSNASLDLHLSRSLISQLCLDNSDPTLQILATLVHSREQNTRDPNKCPTEAREFRA